MVREGGGGHVDREGAAGLLDILDPLGTALLDVDLAVAAPGARIVLFGNAAGGAPEPLPPFARLLSGNVSVGGFSARNLAARAPHRLAAAMGAVLDLRSAGRVEVEAPTVVPLAEVARVHDLLRHGRGDGKYVARLR